MKPRKLVRSTVEAALRATTDLPDEAIRDIGFHLVDWLDDLEAWYSVCTDPEGKSPAEVTEAVEGLLIHAPPHIVAASKLLTGNPVTDVFGVGAVSIEDDANNEPSHQGK